MRLHSAYALRFPYLLCALLVLLIKLWMTWWSYIQSHGRCTRQKCCLWNSVIEGDIKHNHFELIIGARFECSTRCVSKSLSCTRKKYDLAISEPNSRYRGALFWSRPDANFLTKTAMQHLDAPLFIVIFTLEVFLLTANEPHAALCAYAIGAYSGQVNGIRVMWTIISCRLPIP